MTDPLAAQSSGDATIEGVVKDVTGALMPAVEVILDRPINGDRRVTITDNTGVFVFRGIPRGTYRLSAAARGFASDDKTVVVSDRAAAVDLVMQVVVTEHVEVTTSILMGMNTTLTGAAIEALPDEAGALLQRIRELAGATDALGQVTVTVDGFGQSLWIPPKQAIQAIRISSNWFAPEFAEPGQARIDIVTRPGASRVSADVRANFSSERMNARNALAPDSPPGELLGMNGYLATPVIPGRLSIVGYGGQWLQRQQRVINATVLDAGLVPLAHVSSVMSPAKVSNVWLGASLQLTPVHMLAVSVGRTQERAENLGLESGLDLRERGYRRDGSELLARGALTSAPSVRFLNELRIQGGLRRATMRADSTAPAVLVLDAFNGGGNQDMLFTATRQVLVDAVNIATVFVASHTIKGGIEGRNTWRRYTDRTNFGGVFLFGSDFERDAGGSPLTGLPLVSPLENYRRTLLGQRGYGPAQFWLARGNPDVRFRDTALGAFVQHDWIVAPRLTLAYGVRGGWQSAATGRDAGVRAGIALALDSGRRNVLRFGAGDFYRPIEPELNLDVMRFDGRQREQLLVERPSFFPTVPATLAATATRQTIYVADANLQAPRVRMVAVNYDRVLSGRMFATMRYGYQRGTRLLRMRNVNAPGLPVAPAFAGLGPVLQYESTGELRRHEATAGWRWDAAGRASLYANYSFVWARSDTDGRTTAPADSLRLDQEFGAAASDRAHYGTVGAHYTLPGGVLVSPYFTAGTGRPFNITTGLDTNGDTLFTERPAVVAAGTPGAIDTPYGWLLAGRTDLPMVPRNLGREPAIWRLDLRVTKTFRVASGPSFALAIGAENVLNRANLEGVNGVVTSPSFGQAKRTGTPRSVTLATGFTF